MNDLIMRRFTILRDGRPMDYDFLCKSSVFEFTEERTVNEMKTLQYLQNVLMFGFPSREGKISVSSMSVLQVPKEKNTTLMHICDISKKALGDHVYGNHAHGQVQHALMKESFMLGCEVPVWNDEQHGFIDCVALIDGRIWILDFKPHAAKEKKASSQLVRYRSLFSLRTGIPQLEISLGYFDHILFYQVF